jgi:hypothetical protein
MMARENRYGRPRLLFPAIAILILLFSSPSLAAETDQTPDSDPIVPTNLNLKEV